MFLYRGVSKDMDAELEGQLIPKGNMAKVSALHDKRIKHDGTFTYDESENNAVRAQHIKSGLDGGCYVSTTKNEHEARRFATSDYTKPGWVYVIDPQLFEKYGVKSKEFNDPLVPHEKEVTIRAEDRGAIHKNVIVKKYEVNGYKLTVMAPIYQNESHNDYWHKSPNKTLHLTARTGAFFPKLLVRQVSLALGLQRI